MGWVLSSPRIAKRSVTSFSRMIPQDAVRFPRLPMIHVERQIQ